MNRVATVLAPNHETSFTFYEHPNPSHKQWFKLALTHPDHWQELASSIPLAMHARLLWCGEPASKMVGSFLKGLLREALMKHNNVHDLAQVGVFRLVFTFPACWKPEDRHRMRDAVKEASLADLKPGSTFNSIFLSEQEAACLAVITGETGRCFKVSLGPSTALRWRHANMVSGGRFNHGL
jgi:hypothetical protein